MAVNRIKEVRPDSLFENYQPLTESQKKALAFFKNISSILTESDMAKRIISDEFPFPTAAFYVFSGKPGVGKTHLMEAVVNGLTAQNPKLRDRIFLLRDNFTTMMYGMSGDNFFNNKPIILLDDLYAEIQGPEGLKGFGYVEKLTQFLMQVYERRSLVIASSNFPFIENVLPLVRQHDIIGRSTSRIAEMFGRGGVGELEIKGPDYREIIAQMAQTGEHGGNIFPKIGEPERPTKNDCKQPGSRPQFN